MRISEVILILSAVPLAVAVLWGSGLDSRLFRWGLVLMGLAFALQLYMVGLYWQVAPAILAYLLILSSCFLSSGSSPWKLRVAGSGALLLLAASVAFLLILPTFRLPAPTGPFAIGTRVLHLVDKSRSDTAFASGHRELMIQAWYPTDVQNGAHAPYRRRAETTLLSSYMAVLKSHSFLDVAFARKNAPHPLLLFNPAWGGQRTQNTYMVEELASHGFIVVAIDHTHNSIPIAFPDGQVLNLSDPQGVHDPVTSVLQEQVAYYDHELKQQADDDLFVLDEVLKQNADPASPWFGTIDTARIGDLGHSFGGAVAVEAAFRDARIRAALNLDGWNFGELGNAPLRKPLMLMYEDSAPPTGAFRVAHDPAVVRVPLDTWDAQNVQRTLIESGGYMLSIRGASHFNYADRGLYSPIRKLTEAGPIKPERVHTIANRYTLAFFSEVLNGVRQPILHQAGSPYAEVTFEEWKAPQP